MTISKLSPPTPPRVSLALVSLMLGACGLLLFFLPILGTPLAVIGMIAGSASLIYAVARTPDALRWPVMGVLVCSVAITVNLAIAYAPLGYIHKRTARSPRPIPVKAYVAPPASTNWMPVADR